MEPYRDKRNKVAGAPINARIYRATGKK